VAHGGLGSNGEIGMIGIPYGLDIANSPLEVHFGHGHYLPTIQVHVEGLKIQLT